MASRKHHALTVLREMREHFGAEISEEDLGHQAAQVAEAVK